MSRTHSTQGEVLQAGIGPLTYTAAPADASAIAQAIRAWTPDHSRRLFARDPTLWTGRDEGRWLGWLDIVQRQRARGSVFEDVRREVRSAGFRDVLLLGMGGSSLAPAVLEASIGSEADGADLHVLDSTDPGQVLAFERRVDLSRTLVIVASKSGTTLEPNILKQYFYDRMARVLGDTEVGRRFVAITDPGSQLERTATAEGFRRIFHGVPEIGGRYSALSDFGLIPAAAVGIDVARLLARADEMVAACGPGQPPATHPGVVLGCVLASLAARGRDKVTLILSPGIASLGAWLEQLLAESTGKAGKALIPVDGEMPGAPDSYGPDRVFVAVDLASDEDGRRVPDLTALEAAGHPVIRIVLQDVYGIGQEFFRWELATAVAGAVLGINPFDQPDVEAAKTVTRSIMAQHEPSGASAGEQPFATSDGVTLFSDSANAAALAGAGQTILSVSDALRAHVARLAEGDYFALLAYLEMNPAHDAWLQKIRHLVRDSTRAATCLGFGPRYLHSTGQAHKGGPGTGVFLLVTCDDRLDVAVPGAPYTFGAVKDAQAQGDFRVLTARARRALRAHVGPDTETGLATLYRLLAQALA